MELTNIELISLHIPKTAGTSFRNILRNTYGKRSVVRLDIDHANQIRLNEKVYTKSVLPKKIKVIHGHFTYEKLTQHFNFSEKTPLITWLRDPVDRVISNYFFLCKIIQNKLNEDDSYDNLSPRMLKTIEEFASYKENRNVMSNFLKGADLNKFTFIGSQNNFKEDLNELAKTLKWEKITHFEDNITGKNKKEISPEIKSFIAEMNSEDLKLIEEVKLLKEKQRR